MQRTWYGRDISLRERALLAFVGLLPLVLVAIFVVAELATPH